MKTRLRNKLLINKIRQHVPRMVLCEVGCVKLVQKKKLGTLTALILPAMNTRGFYCNDNE